MEHIHYTGNEDPKDIDIFLEDLINEMQDLLDNGIQVTHQQIVKPLRIRTYTCVMLRQEPFLLVLKDLTPSVVVISATYIP